MSTNCPFSGRLLEPIAKSPKAVHRIRPATIFRPKTAHHGLETGGVPDLFNHSVVCMTTNAISSAKRREIAENVITGRKSGADMARLYNISQPTVSRIVAAHRTPTT